MIRQQVKTKQNSVLKYLSVYFSTVLYMDSGIQIKAQMHWVVSQNKCGGSGPWAASQHSNTCPCCGVLHFWWLFLSSPTQYTKQIQHTTKLPQLPKVQLLQPQPSSAKESKYIVKNTSLTCEHPLDAFVSARVINSS